MNTAATQERQGTGARSAVAPGVSPAVSSAEPRLDAARQAAPGNPSVSVVIPVFNEYDNLHDLVDQVAAAMAPLVSDGRTFELLLIDDGSNDDSRTLLAELAATRPWLLPLTLIRNYGQATALQAGFDHARGDYVVTLDGDLQNDPVEIPRLLAMLDADPKIDAVSGWR
ncbi:MAG TPA: glycosyltransferase, partial [Burkholderiaceae bacterium]|nr:glycosyltransferase [Burkholderiaceae bacterium]